MNSIMPMIIIGTIVGCVILGIIIVIVIIRINLNMNPFVYPAIKLSIDISGRKNPTYSEYIDQWVIDNHNKDFSDMSENIINDWEEKCELIIKSSSLGVGKKREYFREMKKIVKGEDYQIFHFEFIRNQTRYQQFNYKKYSYNVAQVVHIENLTLNRILEIKKELRRINYETTRDKYNAKNQRKLMTKNLRQRIMERDRYTCQKCGKVMLDGVGLQIDHIVAIKNGGKSVESNLQVLCDKCNQRKGAKQQKKAGFDVTQRYTNRG